MTLTNIWKKTCIFVMIQRKYQTFWPRFAASMIDGIILMPLAYFAVLIRNYAEFTPPFLLLIWRVSYSMAPYTYSILLHGKYGQTVGKMITKVRVLDLSEEPLSMVQAIRRDIIPLVLTFIVLFMDSPRILSGKDILNVESYALSAAFMLIESGWGLTELITMLISNKRRALHDFIARSVVVRCHPEQPGKRYGCLAVILIFLMMIFIFFTAKQDKQTLNVENMSGQKIVSVVVKKGGMISKIFNISPNKSRQRWQVPSRQPGTYNIIVALTDGSIISNDYPVVTNMASCDMFIVVHSNRTVAFDQKPREPH